MYVVDLLMEAVGNKNHISSILEEGISHLVIVKYEIANSYATTAKEYIRLIKEKFENDVEIIPFRRIEDGSIHIFDRWLDGSDRIPIEKCLNFIEKATGESIVLYGECFEEGKMKLSDNWFV